MSVVIVASASRWHVMVALAACLVLAPAARAQQAGPLIGYVYPAGGCRGTEFEVSIGGRFLGGAGAVSVSGAGVRAAVVEHIRPVTGKQATELREELAKLRQKQRAAGKGGPGGSKAATKPAFTDEDRKRAGEIIRTLADSRRRMANPAIAETVVIKVTVDADAEPGHRELRLATQRGLSNPLVFCVGELPEFREKETENAKGPAVSRKLRPAVQPGSAAGGAEMDVELPAIVNGRIMPGDVDRFRFKASKGQRLVVAAGARELIPYLSDAVPGWFQAVLALYDAKGRELAYADDFRFNPDPVVYYEIPDDGQYVVEIRDAIYRGREDFVYRIAIGELPFVTSIFPLGGRAGAETTVELKGWNLPAARLTPPVKTPGIHPVFAGLAGCASKPMPFAVDTLPECMEREPNNQPPSAQAVTLPIIVNGRIARPGDMDVFRFEGRAGSKVVAEVCARRLNSPLDSMLKLVDATGRQLAFNDDHEDKGAGLTTHHADSWLLATLPADGAYYLHLGDVQHKGGAEYAYRLRVSPPRPDFELRVVPSGISVRGGATVPLTVYALRRDGFAGEISLALKDAPAGFALSGGRVPPSQDQVRFTLTAPPTAPKEPLALYIEGRATIQGRQVVHPAVPADDVMQAFAYRHLVPAGELNVVVSGRGGGRAGVKILGEIPVEIPAGGTARVQVALPGRAPAGTIQLELNEPPEGIAIRSVSPGREGIEIVLHSDAAKAKVGLEGNLIVNAFVLRSPPAGADKKQGSKRRIRLGTLPAIPFKIVAK